LNLAVTAAIHALRTIKRMTIHERMVGDIVVLDVDGRISATERRRKLQVAVERLLEEGQRQIVINMQLVPYIDSTGLADIIEIVRAARRYDAALRLVRLNGRVHELLTLTKLTSVVDVLVSEEEALASFGVPA
jgi:anti-anti-sigma factor